MSGVVNQTLTEPTLLPTRIERDHIDMWLETPLDVHGDPIMDAAKQLPLKPVFTNQSVAIYYITKFVEEFTDEMWRDRHNTLNSMAWNGWARGEAWCACRFRPVTINAVAAFEVTYTVRCLRGFGWLTKIPEAGYGYLDGSDLKDWTTADGTLTIGKLTEDGEQADVDDDLIVSEKETKRLINFSFLA